MTIRCSPTAQEGAPAKKDDEIESLITHDDAEGGHPNAFRRVK